MEKKKLRRLNYLTSVSPYVPKEIFEDITSDKWKLYYFVRDIPKQRPQIAEAHSLFNELEYDEQQRKDYWEERFFQYQRKADQYHNQYQRRPIKIRKDNKDTINYSHNRLGRLGNGPTIRYPKKVRKTAWKRFYKLFPHLKKKNKNGEV